MCDEQGSSSKSQIVSISWRQIATPFMVEDNVSYHIRVGSSALE